MGKCGKSVGKMAFSANQNYRNTIRKGFVYLVSRFRRDKFINSRKIDDSKLQHLGSSSCSFKFQGPYFYEFDRNAEILHRLTVILFNRQKIYLEPVF